MDITLAGGAVTYEPNDDQLGRVSLEFAAFDGEVGVGQLPVPDSAAALTVADGRAARVVEIATRLTDGFILDQDRVRGPQPAGTAREHTFSVQDANALLDGFRIARSRPSETDYARVIAFAAADGPTWDTTWVLNVNTVTMNAKRYYGDGGWTSELIPDLVDFTGKTLFLHDKAGGGRCLHYHNLTSGHTCGLTISDVPSAVNGTTVFAPGQPTRNRTSVDLRNSIKGVDQAGRRSIQADGASIAAHDADGLQHEAQVSFDATSQSDLGVKVAAYLASFKDERDTYTCTIGPLDATALSLIRVGDLVTTTSSVMGLTASAQRIAHMTLSVWSGIDGPPAPGLWQALLELGAPIRRRARVKNKATTNRTQHDPADDGSLTGIVCEAFDSDWVGWAFNAPPNTVPTVIGGTISIDGYDGSGVKGATRDVTLTGASDGTLSGIIDTPSDGDYYITIDLVKPGGLTGYRVSLEINRAVDPDPTGSGFVRTVTGQTGSYTTTVISSKDPTDPPSDVNPTLMEDIDGTINFRIREGSGTDVKVWKNTEPGWTPAGPDMGGTIDEVQVILQRLDTALSMTVRDVEWCYDTGVTTAFHWTVYGPVAVQESPDGSTFTFTLPDYPGGDGYVAGTLHTYVDGIEQDHTETDPAAGTFTLPWAPDTGDQITASWLVP